MKDLTSSKVDLHAYTLKSIMFLIPLVENHLSELVAIGAYLNDPDKFKLGWVRTDFCRECLVRHGGEIGGYALECIRGACDPTSAWADLHNLGSEIYDFFEPKKKIEDYTKEVFEKAKEFVARLRDIRKRLISGDGEHITEQRIREK